MIVYHISETLREGDALENNHGRYDRLAEPFLQALEMGEEWLRVMVLQGKYLFQVLDHSSLRELADYAKWAAEAVFEHVRRTEFPHCPSRLAGCFYYETKEQCCRLYHQDWDSERPEIRAKIHLLAIELDDPAPARFDMKLYDTAYAAIEKRQDLGEAIEMARKYFSGGRTEDPVWEILSGCPARAVKNLASGSQLDCL